MNYDKFLTKKITVLAAGVIVVCSSFWMSQLFMWNKDRNEVKDQKPYSQIISDSASFNVDMQVADNLSDFYNTNKYVRLKMDEDKPVAVLCENNMDLREKEIIKKVVNYYNKIFSTINENYRFEFVEDEKDIAHGSTTIEFVNEVVNGNAVGEARIKEYEKYTRDGVIVNKARILMDWEQMKDKNDFMIYSIAFHEFTHALGLGDVYTYMNRESTIDTTTIMNTNYWDEVQGLFPNDYAILQVLYSNEYKKHDTYEEAVKVVNDKIQKYTDSFYKHYVNSLKEKCYATNKLKLEQIPEVLEWRSISVDYGANAYALKLKDNNECELVLKDDKGNVLEICEGKTKFVDGVLFVNNLMVNKASNYKNRYKDNENTNIKLSMRVFIDKMGNLVIQDTLDIKYLDVKVLKNSSSR